VFNVKQSHLLLISLLFCFSDLGVSACMCVHVVACLIF
jgi:hypothetical protein